MKQSSWLIWLMLAVMVCGIVLCVGLRDRRLAKEAEVAEVERLSAESEAAWHATDDAKILLQSRNQELEETAREAELQLEDSNRKNAEIQAQLGPLAEEKDDLTARLAAAGERKDRAQAEGAALADQIERLNLACEALEQAVETGDPAAVEAAAEEVRRLVNAGKAE